MTLRSADLRFVLPHRVETALIVGAERQAQLASMAAGLAEAGIRLASRGSQRPDVVVAAARDAAEALELPGRTHLLLGRAPARMRRANERGLPLVMRGDPAAPNLVLPLVPAMPVQHYLRRLAAPRSRLARGRNRSLAVLARLPVPTPVLVPPRAQVTLVPERGGRCGPPAILRAAQAVGLRSSDSWILSLGTGDELQRAVFHVLDGQQPAWVVKFSRVPGHDASFRRDAAGLALARAAGGAVAAHAPAHLGQLDIDGLTASVETAAAGRQLLHLLPRRPLHLLDAIAEWTGQLGRRTARPAGALEEEKTRLRRLLAEQGRHLGVPADLVDLLPSVPAVLQHNDLGSWNIVSDGRAFTVVDWESAQGSGFPLWDLFYFAADVLARLDGPADADVLLWRTLRIFAGQSSHSARLFRWLRAAATQLGVPTSALGALASLCWLHHGQSAARRRVDLRGAASASPSHLALLTPLWLRHPGLGPSWPALGA